MDTILDQSAHRTGGVAQSFATASQSPKGETSIVPVFVVVVGVVVVVVIIVISSQQEEDQNTPHGSAPPQRTRLISGDFSFIVVISDKGSIVVVLVDSTTARNAVLRDKPHRIVCTQSK